MNRKKIEHRTFNKYLILFSIYALASIWGESWRKVIFPLTKMYLKKKKIVTKNIKFWLFVGCKGQTTTRHCIISCENGSQKLMFIQKKTILFCGDDIYVSYFIPYWRWYLYFILYHIECLRFAQMVTTKVHLNFGYNLWLYFHYNKNILYLIYVIVL